MLASIICNHLQRGWQTVYIHYACHTSTEAAQGTNRLARTMPSGIMMRGSQRPGSAESQVGHPPLTTQYSYHPILGTYCVGMTHSE